MHNCYSFEKHPLLMTGLCQKTEILLSKTWCSCKWSCASYNVSFISWASNLGVLSSISALSGSEIYESRHSETLKCKILFPMVCSFLKLPSNHPCSINSWASHVHWQSKNIDSEWKDLTYVQWGVWNLSPSTLAIESSTRLQKMVKCWP